MRLLPEDQVGTDQNKIGFPKLIICMGVVVEMDNGTLIGAHYTPGAGQTQVSNAFNTAITNNGGAMTRMYCISHYDAHQRFHGSTVPAKAAAINFHGTVYLLNLDNKSSASGTTYAEVEKGTGNNRCAIRYKRQAKVDMIEGPIGGGVGPVDAQLKTSTNLFGQQVPGTWHEVTRVSLNVINIP